jgi:ATP-dependent RNA helicase DDX41
MSTSTELKRTIEQEDEETYVPYVPLKKRREAEREKLASKLKSRVLAKAQNEDEEDDEDKGGEDEEAIGQRKSAQTLLQEAQEVKRRKAEEGEFC